MTDFNDGGYWENGHYYSGKQGDDGGGRTANIETSSEPDMVGSDPPPSLKGVDFIIEHFQIAGISLILFLVGGFITAFVTTFMNGESDQNLMSTVGAIFAFGYAFIATTVYYIKLIIRAIKFIGRKTGK